MLTTKLGRVGLLHGQNYIYIVEVIYLYNK